jgi:hypothetical protein
MEQRDLTPEEKERFKGCNRVIKLTAQEYYQLRTLMEERGELGNFVKWLQTKAIYILGEQKWLRVVEGKWRGEKSDEELVQEFFERRRSIDLETKKSKKGEEE